MLFSRSLLLCTLMVIFPFLKSKEILHDGIFFTVYCILSSVFLLMRGKSVISVFQGDSFGGDEE